MLKGELRLRSGQSLLAVHGEQKGLRGEKTAFWPVLYAALSACQHVSSEDIVSLFNVPDSFYGLD